jgi:hypothetical protein
MSDNFEKSGSANWTTDLLASRLYAENGQKLNKGSTAKKNAKPLNTRMVMSQSTPTLKTISSSETLERKSTLKTSKLLGETNRNIFKHPVLVPSSSNALPPLQSHRHSPTESTIVQETLPKPSTTFLQSLNLSPKLHHELFHVPHTFFYLQSKIAIDTKAYDLQLISQDKVDKNQYYTISKEGITLHRASDSEFTSLAQWEREYSLFHQISVIPFFRQYRRWKVSLPPLTSYLLFSLLVSF